MSYCHKDFLSTLFGVKRTDLGQIDLLLVLQNQRAFGNFGHDVLLVHSRRAANRLDPRVLVHQVRGRVALVLQHLE